MKPYRYGYSHDDTKGYIFVSYRQVFRFHFMSFISGFHAAIVWTRGLSVMILFRFQIIPASCERGLRVHFNFHYVFETDQYCDGAWILIRSTHIITYPVANLHNYARISGIDFRECLSLFRRNYHKWRKTPSAIYQLHWSQETMHISKVSGPWGGRADPWEINFFEKILSNSRPLGKYCLSNSPSPRDGKIQ